MPLGNPIRKQNESRMVSVLATEGQTVFTVQGGYIINHISVFRNGVRLSPAEDFTAGDGSTVTLNNAANVEDRIDFHIFDRFTVQNAIIGAASTQTINGDLVLNGKLFGALDVPSINLTGIVTATELDLNGKGDISGDLNVVGVTTTGGGNINGDLNVTGVTTVGKQVHVGTGVSIAAGGLNVTAGISTFQAVQGTTGTFSAAVSGTTGTFSGAVSGTTGTFSGDITANGNIAGDNSTNITGIAGVTATTLTGTLQTAAQANVTSVGTLTALTVSGDVSIADKIIHTGDTNTAIRFPAADTVSVETGGSERLRITSGGDMGLGTNSPASSHDRVLTIAGTNSAELKLSGSNYGVTDTDGADVLFSYGGLYLINNESTGQMHFHTGSGVPERMRITSAGQVGINTTVAGGSDHLLEIYGIANNYATLSLKSQSLSHGAALELGANDDDDYGSIYQFASGSGEGGRMRFIAGATETLNLRGGKVGIGNNNPAFMLDLRGATENSLRLGNTNESGHGSHNSKLVAGNSYYQNFDFQASNYYFQTYNGSSLGERMRIANSGEVTFKNKGGGTIKVGGDSAHTSKIVIADNGGTSNGNCLVEGGDGSDFFTITSAGNIKFASGKGIDFSLTSDSSGTMSSELLDDYEEGNCTPNFQPASGSYGILYQSGHYTRIGDVVHVTASISVNGATNASGEVQITGLPFSVRSVNSTWSGEGGHGVGRWFYAGPNHYCFLVCDNSTDRIRVHKADGTFLNHTNMSTGYNTSQFSFTVTYLTDS